MFQHWGCVEADFMREYKIDLVEGIDNISWRRFITLLNNLSGDSVYIWTLQAKKEGKIAVELTDEESSRLLDSFF